MSKVHYSVPLIIYVPIVLYFSIKDFLINKEGLFSFSGFFLLGILVWSFTEYILHRFLFHFIPKSSWGSRLHFIFHGVHHDYPNDAKRLVMPPSVSLPLAILFYCLFSLFLSIGNLYAFFPGFVTGYLVYDISHYAIHHFNFKSKHWKKIKKHHMLHHYSNSSKAFGVSSPLWDNIFQSNLN
ncbi:MAG: sterol desaturase family protein [Flavipsychrobacter sp.]|nr:sterol desaturase family protein [Flavipsychrobacter sp.]